MDKQPVCSHPQSGSLSTGSGYTLCVNPEHRDSPKFDQNGPVWHLTQEFPKTDG